MSHVLRIGHVTTIALRDDREAHRNLEDEDTCLGAWLDRDSDTVYFDTTCVIDGEEATMVDRSEKQIAILNLERMEETRP